MSDSPDRATGTSPDLEEIIEIRDPAIDVRRVMAEIRRSLRAHGPFEPPVLSLGSDEPVGPDEFAFQLAQAKLSSDQVWVELDVQSPPAPLVGAWIARAKRLAHELVVYYVNNHAARQVQFNTSITQAVSALGARQFELDALRQEVAALKTRLADLEARQ